MKKMVSLKKWMALCMAVLMAVGCLQLGTAKVQAESKDPTSAAYTTGNGSDFQSTAEAAKDNAQLGSDLVQRKAADSAHAINSTVSYTDSSVKVTKADGEEGVFLYVQGNINDSDWVYSRAVASEEITASTIQTAKGLTEAPVLSSCRIWLEKQFDDGLYIVKAVKSTDTAAVQETPAAAKDSDDEEDTDDGINEDADPAIEPAEGGENLTDADAVSYNVKINKGNVTSATPDEPIAAGTEVTIKATVPSGYTFVNWTVDSGNVTLADENAETTTFIMPAEDVEITANIKKVYKVTVKYGSADKTSYAARDKVTITAKVISGKTFDSWTVNSGNADLDNYYADTTTFDMPEGNVIVTANYTTDPTPAPKYYKIVVANGTASAATAKAGDKITITAATAKEGKFNRWIINKGDISLANANSAKTTFTMPAGNVKVTAEYTKLTAAENFASDSITSELKAAGYDTADKIQAYLKKMITGKDSSYNTFKLYDINLKYSTDNGANWKVDDGSRFPSDGKNMTLPYPSGTDKNTTFIVYHMVSRAGTYGGKSYNAGDCESPEVTNTDSGISFKLYSLSPVMIAWKSSSVAVTGVSLNKTSLTYSKTNLTYQLKATVTPTNATNKAVTWSSSDTSVATVSSKGVVTSKGKGSCTITVTTKDGGKTAACKVKVTSNTAAKSSSDGTVKAKSAKTGDSSPIMTYVIILVIAAAALVVLLLVYLRKRKNKE